MQEFILHHYAGSPFSEKIRLIFGWKGIAWTSVEVPPMLPKPDVVALTGGYRRTPFLQIGADIYCDTALMCQVIEAAHPTPTLYPEATRGAAEILAHWADTALFWVGVPFTMQPAQLPHMFGNLPPEFIAAFAADRAAMSPNLRRYSTDDAAAILRTQFARLENMLGHGQEYLFGTLPCIADFSLYHIIWYMRRAPISAALCDEYPAMTAWFARMTAFGHATSTKMSSTDAMALAAATIAYAQVAVTGTATLAAGQAVTVTPADYAHDAVVGTLIGLTDASVTISRQDERAGEVHVHFPRTGYQIKKV